MICLAAFSANAEKLLFRYTLSGDVRFAVTTEVVDGSLGESTAEVEFAPDFVVQQFDTFSFSFEVSESQGPLPFNSGSLYGPLSNVRLTVDTRDNVVGPGTPKTIVGIDGSLPSSSPLLFQPVLGLDDGGGSEPDFFALTALVENGFVLNMLLTDPSGAAFSSEFLPQEIDINDFTDASTAPTLDFELFEGTTELGTLRRGSFDIISILVEVSVIPEPSVLGLAGAGVFWCMKRRRCELIVCT